MENKMIGNESLSYGEIKQYKPVTLEGMRLNESLNKCPNEELKSSELIKYEKAKLCYDALMFRN